MNLRNENDISYYTAQTEEAEAELKLAVPLFEEMLLLTELIKDCKVIRFDKFTANCRSEEYNGHYLNKEFDNYDFNSNEASVLSLGQE